MTDMKKLAEGHAPTTPQHRIECPVWHRPLYVFVPDGIVCRCRSCGSGATHFTSKDEAMRIWEAMGERKESGG